MQERQMPHYRRTGTLKREANIGCDTGDYMAYGQPSGRVCLGLFWRNRPNSFFRGESEFFAVGRVSRQKGSKNVAFLFDNRSGCFVT